MVLNQIMNPIVASLLEFNEAFEIPKLEAPGLGPDELIELRIKLLTVEVKEYAEAARSGDLVHRMYLEINFGNFLIYRMFAQGCSIDLLLVLLSSG